MIDTSSSSGQATDSNSIASTISYTQSLRPDQPYLDASSSSKHNQQMSPPLTPQTSTETFAPHDSPHSETTTFHHYLRAFYHFHPSSTVSSTGDESSITVPINQGDVILVHSIHPNGWADGSLLTSGARGWLPTNYCEPYDPPEIRTLLNSLTNLWDLVRSPEHESLIVFSRQDYVKGMIAGVRFFLEQTSCLSRDSALILSHVGLRRLRKGLLSDLSMLVRIAKELQFAVQNDTMQTVVFEQLDELVLKAFKVVERAVRFHDIWSQDVDNESAAALSMYSSNRPLTPPNDTANEPLVAAGAVQPVDIVSAFPQPANHSLTRQHSAVTDVNRDGSVRRIPVAHAAAAGSDAPDSTTSRFVPRPASVAQRASLTHRLSYLGKSGAGHVQKQKLASERLGAAHDAFMSLLGTFIGLHINSRSTHDLANTTHKSVVACRELIAVVEDIWVRDGRRIDPLKTARDVMYAKLAELVSTAREMLSTVENGEDILNPEQGNRLVMTTTNCILAAGDCVSKARHTIERSGDFEIDQTTVPSSDQIFDDLASTQGDKSMTTDEPPSRAPSVLDKPLPVVPGPPEPAQKPPLPPVNTVSKPLPSTPMSSSLLVNSPADTTKDDASIQSIHSADTVQPKSASSVQEQPNSPPLPSQSEQANHDFMHLPRTDSINTSTASAADTFSSWRDSVPDVASMASRPSTRATTPDRSPVLQQQSNEPVMLKSVSSVTELQSVTSDGSALEEQVLETTFAHELIPSKDGQVLGGSLAALVERLTTHDSTPDATFVTTFYLTFRLFTTPQQFAECLVDRFDYVGDSISVGAPVRLRIYNVFKGWLETHWHQETDAEVLPFITDFATGKMSLALPSAGRRILELATKVAEQRNCALVPRLVSSLGRFSTTVTSFSSADGQIPPSIISKSQLNALRQARLGNGSCSVLDFDPLEIARQLTIIESRLYCSISPDELLNFEYTKKSEARVANVLAMSTLATDLTNLIAESILQYDEPKKRAIMIKQWIKISMKCLELANYDTLMAIICSINSSVVLRLKKTWELVSQKTKNRLEELSAIVDCSRNHAVLRERLKNHVAPCIPYVGMYLTDLTFTHAGNPPTRELPGVEPKRSVINFDRCMKIAKTIGEVQRFQIPYRLAAVPELQEWMEMQVNRISRNDAANTHQFYRRSLLLEPRENGGTQPRGHWYNGYSGTSYTGAGSHQSTYQPTTAATYQPTHPNQSQSESLALTKTDTQASKESFNIASAKEAFDFQAN